MLYNIAMKNFRKKINALKALAIVLSISFPAGIFSIIYGATNGITPLLISGIVMTAVSFYGCPVAWSLFATNKQYETVLRLVTEENMYRVDEMAAHLMKKPEEITSAINVLVSGGYLKGFVFKDGVLYLNTNRKQTGKDVNSVRCKHCGGTVYYNGVNYVCEYCGSTVEPEDAKQK